MVASRRSLAVGLVLVGLVLAVYGKTWNHEFIDFDDREYIVDNPFVNRGLSWDGVRWAFTRPHASNWHPLTWLSHMADCELFGLAPGPPHLINALLHAANALLLYIALQALTGERWPASIAAALFALHPLRVQSVAWAAQRKELLAALFGLAALVAYARYARKPTSGRYLWVVALFALGLLAKPTLVTLPALLLLLDFWPLRRRGPLHLLREKLPLFALTFASSLVTLASQERGGSVISTAALPLAARVENALVSYVVYLRQMLWPSGLAVHYPHPWEDPATAHHLPLAAAGCGLLLAALTFIVLRARLSQPHLAVGWLWYLGTLVPMIGLVQVGWQGHADRYTYLASIGIAILVVWAMRTLVERFAVPRAAVASVTALVLAALAAASFVEVGYWRSSPVLFERALAVTHRNALVHNNYGNWLVAHGRTDEGAAQLEEAARLLPDSPLVQAGLGAARIKQQRLHDAIEPLSRAAAASIVDARRNLAHALYELGRLSEAEQQFELLLGEHPEDPLAHHKLGQLRLRRGQVAEARAEFEEAVRLAPSSAELRTDLAMALSLEGQLEPAIAELHRALEIEPDYFLAHHRLGLVLLAAGRPAEAVASFQRALASKPGYEPAVESLEAARARLGGGAESR